MAIGALYGGLSVTFRFCREVAGEGKVSERLHRPRVGLRSKDAAVTALATQSKRNSAS